MSLNFENINNSYKKTAFKALASPLFIAFILTLPIIFFIPKTERYKVSELGQSNSVYLSDSYIKHYDISNDGETEIIYAGNNQLGNHSIVILHPDGKVLNQWNFRGSAPKIGERFFVGDADGNGFNEVYVFSQVEDSIFLNYFEPFNIDGISDQNIFIDKVDKIDGKVDFIILSPQLFHMETNETKSLLFAISAGYSIQPRNVYSYNPLTRVVKKSPTSGARIYSIQATRKKNSDETFIFSSTFAPGNTRSHMQIPYSDSSAWVMAFNKNLEFLFPPIEFPGFNRQVQTYPIVFEDEANILVFSLSEAKCDTCQLLFLYDMKGNELARRELFDYPDGTLYLLNYLDVDNQTPMLFAPETGNLFEVNSSLDLKFIKKIPTKGSLYSTIKSLDFSDDGKADFFVMGFSKGIVFFDANLKTIVTYDIDYLERVFDYTLGVRRREGQMGKELSFQVGNNQVVLSLTPNPLQYLKWLILLGYYLGVTVIVYISQRIYQSRANRTQKLEKELLSLQTQMATSQLDPHFVSNALNSINAYVLLDKNIDAFQYILKFSNLVQETLKSSDHITRTLAAELAFVGNFLDLERKRKANFDYRIDVDSTVDSKAQVPKMAIQIFAENAVKHGFNGSEYMGKLIIEVSQEKAVLQIVIKDNGVGMEKSSEYVAYSSKRGISTIEKVFLLHQKLFNRQISYKMKNLTPENDGQTGTEVRIRLEVNGEG